MIKNFEVPKCKTRKRDEFQTITNTEWNKMNITIVGWNNTEEGIDGSQGKSVSDLSLQFISYINIVLKVSLISLGMEASCSR